MAFIETLPDTDGEVKATYEGFGEVTVNGWLLLLAAHLDLHLKQLRTMQKGPEYPVG